MLRPPSCRATPNAALMTERHDHLTFRGNLRETRYGWLRLTPAYSVHLVGTLLDQAEGRAERVLDPFCGTGTTALVCAERGIEAATADINPFLLWLAHAKTRRYTARDRARFGELSRQLARVFSRRGKSPWTPALFQIEKWWDAPTLAALGRFRAELRTLEESEPRAVIDRVKIAFCRTLIASANVSFGHQSMSFSARAEGLESQNLERARKAFAQAVESLTTSATSRVARVPKIVACDARALGERFAERRFSRVITSPPYPNRMSYVRELRPYMYWLGYLSDGRSAGELDWHAIGGTWGMATSRVARWEPTSDERVPAHGFDELVGRIAERSDVLSRYVHKYFCDMTRHCRELFPLVAPRGKVHYIVGNSKFYDVLVPVERLFAELFEAVGFRSASVTRIRKRSSKRELYEFLVSAEKPASA